MVGWTSHRDAATGSVGDCASDAMVFDGLAGRRIAFDVTNTRFTGAGVALALRWPGGWSCPWASSRRQSWC